MVVSCFVELPPRLVTTRRQRASKWDGRNDRGRRELVAEEPRGGPLRRLGRLHQVKPLQRTPPGTESLAESQLILAPGQEAQARALKLAEGPVEGFRVDLICA